MWFNYLKYVVSNFGHLLFSFTKFRHLPLSILTVFFFETIFNSFDHYFLGISMTRFAAGMILLQSKYTEEIIARANLSNCNPCVTPISVNNMIFHETWFPKSGTPVSTLIPRSTNPLLLIQQILRLDISVTQGPLWRSHGISEPC